MGRPTRWALAATGVTRYSTTFTDLVARGADVDGEARLADAVAPRGARILDAGSGMGRVAAALAARGHQVVAAEPDPTLVEQSLRTYPHLPVVPLDILSLTPEALASRGGPAEFDVIVCVGNVMIYLAEDSEVAVLTRLRELLAPGGRILVGFHLTDGPSTARVYPPDEFVADATAAGLRVDLRAGSYELHPANDEYAVWLLSSTGD
ncbi:Methyltransferase domain-containing protein [Nocardioides terrae]|uniref:Methyltransferase domain-containing protein n=1 Tax=Nocardioides terrae TaxID=574651 RepID=A0A1I1N3K5_9ACTN|nr:class I SAM-dependent methyltransferase [Nocardioides terrae]SFC88380.1 Methyltransferase domain-containing protein [Nocardioides terrae]